MSKKLKDIEGLMKYKSTYDIPLKDIGNIELEIDAEKVKRIICKRLHDNEIRKCPLCSDIAQAIHDRFPVKVKEN